MTDGLRQVEDPQTHLVSWLEKPEQVSWYLRKLVGRLGSTALHVAGFVCCVQLET